MPYVRRDENGDVTAISLIRDDFHDEALDNTAPEVVAFMGRLGGSTLSQSDLTLVRVLEDLLDVLVEKSVIRFTDLPEAAQQKLLERRSMRSSMRAVRLIGDDGLDAV